MKMIKLHKGDGKTMVTLDYKKLCFDYIKKNMITITPAKKKSNPRAAKSGSEAVDRG